MTNPAAVSDSDRAAPTATPSGAEPDTRYQRLLDCYRAARQLDPHSPGAPTHMERSFSEGRQIPEGRAVQMLEQLCSSPQVQQVAQLIEKRLGRPLEPFDVWYSGFRPGAWPNGPDWWPCWPGHYGHCCGGCFPMCHPNIRRWGRW